MRRLFVASKYLDFQKELKGRNRRRGMHTASAASCSLTHDHVWLSPLKVGSEM